MKNLCNFGKYMIPFLLLSYGQVALASRASTSQPSLKSNPPSLVDLDRRVTELEGKFSFLEETLKGLKEFVQWFLVVMGAIVVVISGLIGFIAWLSSKGSREEARAIKTVALSELREEISSEKEELGIEVTRIKNELNEMLDKFRRNLVDAVNEASNVTKTTIQSDFNTYIEEVRRESKLKILCLFVDEHLRESSRYHSNEKHQEEIEEYIAALNLIFKFEDLLNVSEKEVYYRLVNLIAKVGNALGLLGDQAKDYFDAFEKGGGILQEKTAYQEQGKTLAGFVKKYRDELESPESTEQKNGADA